MDEACALVSGRTSKILDETRNVNNILEQTYSFDEDNLGLSLRASTSAPLHNEEFSSDNPASLLDNPNPVVTPLDVRHIVSEISGILIDAVRASCDYEELEQKLNSRVIGQSKAIEILISAVKRSELGLRDESRPKGIFLFL
jgi:ATP-dependent Clp protease ATP-binding subunit ClpA